MDIVKQFVIQHILAVPVVAATLAYAAGRVDDIILFLLRFFPAQTIKDELDRLDTAAKIRVDKDAALPPAPHEVAAEAQISREAAVQAAIAATKKS